MASPICCAKCCTVFSASGIIFLVIIGIMLQKQPLYVKGPTDTAAAAQGCYQGALIYFCFLAVSVAYWIYDEMKVGIQRRLGFSSTTPTSNKFGGQYGAVSTSGK